ncbi:MAG: sodium:solute symporter, partial [Gemmatimonadales bacterium]
MESLGWVSILPPILAIGLAIWTRQVFLSLGFFVWFGWTIINGWNPVAGLADGVETLVAAVGDEGNARTLMFSALIGAMIVYTQRSGGMQGFVNWAAASRLT